MLDIAVCNVPQWSRRDASVLDSVLGSAPIRQVAFFFGCQFSYLEMSELY